MPGSVAPERRRWRKVIAMAVAAMALSVSVCTGVALGQSGGIDPDDPPPEPPPPTEPPPSGDFKLGGADADPHKTFFDGLRAPKITYTYDGEEGVDARIEVVSRETKEVVDSFIDTDSVPGTTNIAYWDGRTLSGALAPNGDYKYRVGAADGSTPTLATKDSEFRYFKYKFPVRKRKHSYGDGFGAGRGHQGQDVFAKCGTKLVAARGGKVQWNKFQSAAGWYLVIDLKGNGKDHMYAHLKKRSPLKAGTRVHTGEKIGKVGQTGNASGCHLHFEIWSKPGWYEGGEARPSVRKSLKTWDSWS